MEKNFSVKKAIQLISSGIEKQFEKKEIRGRNYTRVTELEPDDEYTVEEIGLGQELTARGAGFRTWK